MEKLNIPVEQSVNEYHIPVRVLALGAIKKTGENMINARKKDLMERVDNIIQPVA